MNKRTATTIKFWIVTIVLLLGITACTQAPQDVEREVTRIVDGVSETIVVTAEPVVLEPIKVGVIFGVTDWIGLIGKQQREGALTLINRVNEEGGINGRQIVPVIRDTGADPQRAVEVIQEMQREGVVAVLGPSSSGQSLAAREFSYEFEIPMIVISMSPAIMEGKMDYVYRAQPTAFYSVQRKLEYISENLGTRVALINDSTVFGQDVTRIVSELKDDYGIVVVADEVFQPTDTDMTAQLLRIRNAEPDAIISWSSGLVTAVIIRQIKDLGIEAQLLTSPNGGQPDVVEAAGDAANGVIYEGSSYCRGNPLPHQVDAVETFESRTGATADWPVILGWSAAEAIVWGLQELADTGQEITGRNLKATLDTLDQTLAMGYMKWSPDVHEMVDFNQVILCRIEGDRREIVD